jgi:serine/threonine protein kinase
MTSYQAGQRISEYVLEERIGCGTFGEVWRARHHIWADELAAVKLPTEPQYVRYLQREGVVVHGLRHPNIVRVVGLDPYAEPPYLVMELVRGPSLKQVIADNPKGVPFEAATTVLRGVLTAMRAAHSANVLHRDLKPGNVMLNLDGRALAAVTVEDVKVGDFGLGIDSDSPDLLRSIAQSVSLARENTLVGTLAYMAPELRDGGKAADARSDLYAVGVMLFELLTGERPAGTEVPSTMRPETPAALDAIFARLYSRHDRRYESAQAALDDLTARWGGSRTHVAGLPPLPAHGKAIRCPNCSFGLEPGDQFCTQCGTQVVQRVRRCPSCNAFPGRFDRFCIFCGGPLAALEA